MAENDQTKRDLRLGVVGLGAAFLGMLPSIVAHPFIKPVAACDVRPEARAKFATDFQAKTYESIEELCNNDAVEAVYIATPNQRHMEQVIAVARHGKHIVIEKPMAITIEDCQAMIDAADQAGVKLLVGYTNSYDPPILAMPKIAQREQLGELQIVQTFNYTDWLYRPRRPDELDTGQGGGVVFRQAPHQVDMLRLIGGGLVRSVRASARAWDRQRPTEAALLAFLDFENGAVGSVIYNGYGHFDAEEFWGKQPDSAAYGTLRTRTREAQAAGRETAVKASRTYGGADQRTFGGARSSGPPEHTHFGITIASYERGDIRPALDGLMVYAEDEVRHIPVPAGSGGGSHATLLDELYDTVVLGKPALHDGRWGMATLEVCLGIFQSSRERREISLTHQIARPD